MIELIFIVGLFAVGVFMVYAAADIIENDIVAAITGILGAGIMFYSLAWFVRWFLLGGLVQ